MIDRILAPAGIGEEQACINAAYSLGDSGFVGTRSHAVMPTVSGNMSLIGPTAEKDHAGPATVAAPRVILSRFVRAMAQLERVEAMMTSKGLRPEADSLARIIADLQWQYRKLGGR